MATKKLTAKQEMFVSEYLKDLNATQAAIRAGYSDKSASRIGVELLNKTQVAAAIAESKAKRLEETKVDANYVLKRLIEIDEMDVCDILDNVGNFKPIIEWPKCWRRTISGLDIQELMVGEVETVMRKIKWPDKVKNLELLGKHIDVQAFKEQKELSGNIAVSHEQMLDQLK